MVHFLILWWLIGVAIIWFSEWKRGNVQRLKHKPVNDWLYAILISLLSWIIIAYVLLNPKDFF